MKCAYEENFDIQTRVQRDLQVVRSLFSYGFYPIIVIPIFASCVLLKPEISFLDFYRVSV